MNTLVVPGRQASCWTWNRTAYCGPRVQHCWHVTGAPCRKGKLIKLVLL